MQDEDFSDDPSLDEPLHARKRTTAAAAGRCPYLDSVNRSLLDFDMQKLCSVTLSPNHVYGCLSCGKFFEGRGKSTQAYTHALDVGHHLFINLHDARVWCLPDMYEVTDASLSDVKLALQPRYSPEAIKGLDSNTVLSKDVSGLAYLPGFVGLNDLKHTDWLNVTVQALGHVSPLRDFFLVPANYAHSHSALVHRFGELLRRLWAPNAFKASISPLEFAVEVSRASGKRFSVGKVADTMEFLTWLLNSLHTGLTEADPAAVAAAKAKEAEAGGLAGGVGAAPPAAAAGAAKARKTSIITDVFQGELEIEIVSSEYLDAREAEAKRKAAAAAGASASEPGEPAAKKRKLDEDGAAEAGGAASSSGAGGGAGSGASNGSLAGQKRSRAEAAAPSSSASSSSTSRVQRVPFLMLSLDLPPAPLYKDDEGGVIIPQVPIFTLLSKYDGVTITDTLRGQYHERKRYRLTRLPSHLIMTVKRFAKNGFFTEKNMTIVNFPLANLDLRPYTSPEALVVKDGAGRPLPSLDALPAMSVSELKGLLSRLGQRAAAATAVEKSELLSAAAAGLAAAGGSSGVKTKYDLVANVVHDAPPDAGTGGSDGTVDPVATGHYRVHVRHGGGLGQWYELQDLRVSDVLPQMLAVSETYILIYKRQGGSG